jgi:hypothetical protein
MVQIIPEESHLRQGQLHTNRAGSRAPPRRAYTSPAWIPNSLEMHAMTRKNDRIKFVASDEPSPGGVLGRVQLRLVELSQELQTMPSWLHETGWHIERATEYWDLRTQRDKLRGRMS